jgi:outer membrane lipoprotein-sorting protein
MRRAIRFGLFALFLQAAAPQTRPDAAEILKKVGETYKGVSQYEFVADDTVVEKTGGPPIVAHMVFAFKAPNKYRMQGAVPGMSGKYPVLADALAIHDGSTLWFYFPKMNQYGSFAASELTEDAGDLSDASPKSMDLFLMGRFRSVADHTAGSKFLREEAIEIAGAKIDCYVCRVVTVSPEGGESTFTWWIDKKRYRVLREESVNAARTSTTVFTEMKLGEPLPDELFTFKPPAGARKAGAR